MLGVVSTNALELGIDIGSLDVGGPGRLSGDGRATWQRAGRAGRLRPSAAVIVLRSHPLDQLFAATPIGSPRRGARERAREPRQPPGPRDHLKCAAFELPFAASERFGREDVQEILGILADEGFVHRSEGEDGAAQWNWTTESYPADAVSLRSISSDNFVVVDLTHGPAVIGETDFTSGPSTLHEKAIYIVEGKLYQVERLDHDNRKAFVREVDCDYYTDAITLLARDDPRRVPVGRR